MRTVTTVGCMVAIAIGTVFVVQGAVICSGESGAVRVDSPAPTSINKALAIYANPDLPDGKDVTVAIDGKCAFSTTNQSETAWTWQPLTKGNHTLRCTFGTNVLTKTLNVTALDFYVTPGPNPPMAKDNNVSITPTTRNFGVNGGGNAILVSGSSATWTAAVSDPWITLNTASGKVGYPVAYTVSANTNVEQRTGYVYVSGWVHTVTQDGVGGTISPENREVEHQGGSGTIAVSAENKMVWQARPNVDWLSVTPTSGAGAGSVTYQVAPYNEVATRQGTLTVAGNTFTVFQYGRRMKLDSYSVTKDYETYVIPITVNALAITQWNVTPNNSWISIVDAGNGQGGDLVTIAIAENPSYKSRTGTVAIGTETFTVTQQGRPTAALSFSVNPTDSTASVNGANGMIAVTATPDLPWTATSGTNWITVYAATAAGAGNGNVVYNASPNPTLSQRTGTVTVTPEAASGMAAKTHTVTQPAAESALSLNGYEFEAAGETCSVEVSVANIVQWSVLETLGWITVNGTTSRVGPGTVVLQATANNTVYPRSGTVKIAGKNFSVSQKARGVELEYDTKLFGTDGGYDSISIHPDGNVSWTAVASDATWITIFQGDSGTGDGEIMYIVAPYVGEEGVRTGWITVGDKRVYITQRAYDLNISPNGSLMTGNSGAGEFSVSAGIGDVWTAIVTEPWITLVSGYDAGTGNGTVRFLYTENTTGKMRTGKIIVNGEVYTLQQRERTMVAITATAEHGGHVSGGGSYDLGSQVTLTAVPDSGYKFSYWTGAVSSMQNPLSVTVDVAKSYTAVFEPLPIAFTSVVSGTSGVSLTWNNLAWAAMYRIYRGTMSVPSSATVLAELPNSGNCTYLDTSGDVNVEYWYWIEAEGPLDEVMSDPMTGRKERPVVNSSITYTNLRGATNPNPATYQEGTIVSFSNPGAVTGYTFAGWTPAQITADMTGAQTVRAAWTANRYSIAYDPNGGSGSMSPTLATYDSEATVSANGFTWSGHVFTGWATNATGEVIYAAGQPVTNLTAQSSGIVTLYAVWEVAELEIDVPTGMETNITMKIGAEYGDLSKRGGGTLTLSAANEFTGTVTNSGGGLIVADIGGGIPTTAGMVFLSGTYAPLSATSLTVPLGAGPGKFDMSLDHLKIAALNAPLTVNFGGSAEPIVSGGPMNPNAKAFHFGWKDDNGEYPITVLNPLVISSNLTLRSQRNAPVTLAGGVCAASGVKGKSLDMPDGWQSQFRFTESGSLHIPGNKWNARGGGTTMFDGGRHEVGDVYGSCHNIVFTNGAHFVSSVCYLGRDNADYVVNVYAYDSVISNASGFVRLGCTSNAKGNWYMKGGELAFAAVSGTKPPSFAIGDTGHGSFYQESGDVKLRNTSLWLGYNSAYSGLYKIDGGTFSTENTMNVGYYGTGTVVVAGGNVDVGNTFVLGQETTACGRMRMSDGTVAYNNNAMIGRYGKGYLLMTGGQLKQNTDMESSLGRFESGVGRLEITGGEYSSCYSGTSYGRYIGWEGTGVVSVASAGLFSFSNTVYLGKAATAHGEIDLGEGGVFETKILSMGDGYQKIVADGGTFRVAGNGATVNFFNNAANLDESYVGRRGVTFDTRDNTATIGNFALDGRSPGVIRKTGSGTLILTGLPQTGGGIEVNEGAVSLASGATVGAAFSVPATDDAGGNSYPASPSDSLVAQNYLLHRWSFNNGSVVDSVAGNVATVHDDNVAEANIAFKDGCVSLSGETTKCVRYIDLGSGLFGDEDGEFTIEFWARVPNWASGSKLFTAGNSATEEIFMDVAGIVCARGVSGEHSVSAWNSTTVPNDTMCHFAVIIGKATGGKRDVRFTLKDATTGMTLGEKVCTDRTYSPILHQDIFAFGYSYHDEADAKMDIDEVRIWKAALSDAQLSANAVRGPDDVPLLNMDGGAGPVQIASGAVFDLGGNTITYPGVAGAGTVRNGAITVDSLKVTGPMSLDADVTVTGEIVFANGAAIVTSGTLNIAGATVRFAAPISVPSLVLASAKGGGKIIGVPAAVDLGVNSLYNLSLDSSTLKAEKQTQEEAIGPLPEVISDSGVADALAGAADEMRLSAHITSKAQYDLFRVWVDANGLGLQDVKDSPRAWFSYAIGASGLIEQAFQNDDLTVGSLSASANGGFAFEVSVKDVSIGAAALPENLATVFSVQGADSPDSNAFSSGNVAVEFGVSPNGRLLVTATPRQPRGSFFFRVRMHADGDPSVEEGTLGPVVDFAATIFVVTFDANGGMGGATRTVCGGDTIGALPTVMRAGYTFDNWWTAKTGGTQVTASTVVTADKTCYARWIKDEEPQDAAAATYCVIDLSAGANASCYPVSYLAAPPAGGFNTDEYKTNKLVLRRIEPGTFIMGDDQSDETHRVTLTKPFYCGLFEVTQRQYELVMGERPSYFNNTQYYATRPVERVSYNMIRGSSAGAGWPGSSAVDADSFIGRLRAKTGILEFDLPTEAQWEYACRAGTTSDYNNGGSSETDLNQLGRYADNGGSAGDGKQSCTPSEGSAKVGSYRPNAWGLYDMHGNVWERCLDWYGSSRIYGVDPKGPSSGTYHVVRGGSWGHNALFSSSAFRVESWPEGRNYRDGFRLARTPKPIVIKPVITHNMVQLWENGPYWAETNIGAENPEDYGYYFWWGDTIGYKRENDAWTASDGSSSNFSFEAANTPTHGKSIATLQNEGWIMADGVLAPEHDAAHVHWGGEWRMPTKQDLEDLVSKCDWTWTTMNGVPGYVVQGKGDYASVSIFLPAAGLGFEVSPSNVASHGSYWSSIPTSDAYNAWRVYFSSGYNYTLDCSRFRGQPVRPVRYVNNSGAASFVVTFDANGGVGGATRSVRAGDSLDTLPIVTREHYTFLGWFTKADDGMQATTSTVVTADTTYYAHWAVDPHGMVQLWENGPYWAETNIGAENPEDYGYYFWWGDTIGYKRENDAWTASDGSSSNFSFEAANTPTHGKSIATLQNEGWIMADGVLAPEHDAAHVHWGGEWRMPTKQEMDDLVSKCDWTWTTMNGVQGYVIRGKDDYASDSISLPVAGFSIGSSLDSAGLIGDYWSSVPHPDGNAWGVFFNSTYHYTRYNYGRYYGYSIRPVQGAAK